MSVLRVRGGGPLRGNAAIPGDKSISHRSLMFNGFSGGRAVVRGLLESEDVGRTRACLEAMGVAIDGACIQGVAGRLGQPSAALDCGNSGTTMRLLLGLLAGQPLTVQLVGDASLTRRPMGRVTGPLAGLGGTFTTSAGYPPVTVAGGAIEGARIRASVASAQVKSAVLLACLQGEGVVQYTEPRLSRDHTERMLGAMGVQMTRSEGADGSHTVEMACGQQLSAVDVQVPADISSAAFFLVAGSVVPGSDIVMSGVGLNPTRTGVLDVLSRMGADVEVEGSDECGGEPRGTLRVRAADLRGTEIGGAEIPRLIDELPVLAVAAALADGETRIRDAQELRVKESDRIAKTVEFLRAMGVDADETPDGMVILGGGAGAELASAVVDAEGDHRIGMAAAVAGLRARGETVVQGADAIRTSFPSFPHLLESLRV